MATPIITNMLFMCVCICSLQVYAQPWLDATLPPAKRAALLVADMTEEELLRQFLSRPQPLVNGVQRLGVPAYSYWAEAAHGIATLPVNTSGDAGHPTVLPSPTGMAATFDVNLTELAGSLIAIEGRARHNDRVKQCGTSTQEFAITYFAPNINLIRDVRWGRSQETFGECPHLISRMGVAMTSGLQNQTIRPDLTSSSVLSGLAMLKHYIAYDLESDFAVGGHNPQERLTFVANITSTDLRQTFSQAFDAAIRESDAGSVMCAYNSVSIDGGVALPMCAHPLIKTELRDRLGWDGYVMSDGGALNFMITKHHVFNNSVTAAAAAMHATVDINSPMLVYTSAHLKQALDANLISVKDQLVPAATRIFAKRFALGLMDNTTTDNNNNNNSNNNNTTTTTGYASLSATTDVDTPHHRAIAREIATASFVLLKNDNNFLPFNLSDASMQKGVAVVGPNSDSAKALVGNYAGCVVDANLTLISSKRPYTLNPQCNLVTPLQGITTALQGSGVALTHVVGCPVVSPNRSGFAAAVKAAHTSAATVVVLGLRACTFATKWGGVNDTDDCVEDEAHDRNSTGLPQIQIDFVRALLTSPKASLFLVVMSGGAVSLPSDILSHTQVLSVGWMSYGGEETGNAIADIIFGVVAPSGRLPFTIVSGLDALPPYFNMKMDHPPGRTYRYLTNRSVNQQFPFGYGLSYLSFMYNELTLSTPCAKVSSPLTTHISVCAVVQASEKGSVPVREVVQVYASRVVASDEMRTEGHASIPLITLVGFTKTNPMHTGESQRVCVNITLAQLQLVSSEGEYGLQTGTWRIYIGGVQPTTQTTQLLTHAHTQLRQTHIQLPHEHAQQLHAHTQVPRANTQLPHAHTQPPHAHTQPPHAHTQQPSSGSTMMTPSPYVIFTIN